MKEVKDVFVIMPFAKANNRNQGDLSEFFNTNLKQRIEGEPTLRHTYRVARSGNEFNMIPNLVSRLRQSHIVLADLSGHIDPNPNVMFELGIRFSISRQPVILFREHQDDNRHVFDVGGLHVFPYHVPRLRELEDYIIDRLKHYEIDSGSYESPVLHILGGGFDATQESTRNEVILNLDSAAASLHVMQRHLAGNVHAYLVSRGTINENDVPNDLREFKNWFQEQVDHEPLASVDWSGLQFRLQSIPALSNLFISSRFKDYLPDALKKEVLTKLLEFYIQHFGVWWGAYRTGIQVHNIMADLSNTRTLLAIVIAFIREDNEAKRLELYDTLVQALRED